MRVYPQESDRYRFGMTEASYSEHLSNGAVGTLSCSMRNDGVAPIYLKGHTGVVKAALMPADDEVLVVTTIKGVDPFDRKPGQTRTHTSEVAFLHHAQAAKIALGVCSRESVAHPDIQLGIEDGTATNWYILSDMPRWP